MWRWWSFYPHGRDISAPQIPDRHFDILGGHSELSDEAVEQVPDDRC